MRRLSSFRPRYAKLASAIEGKVNSSRKSLILQRDRAKAESRPELLHVWRLAMACIPAESAARKNSPSEDGKATEIETVQNLGVITPHFETGDVPIAPRRRNPL
jgi:hypothetical protein